MSRVGAAALVYVAAAAGWVYGIIERIDAADDEPWLFVSYAALAVLHVGVGYAIARWWAVLLPARPIPLAVPAEYVPDTRPEFPIWFALALLAPFGCALLAAGVAAARIARGRARAAV